MALKCKYCGGALELEQERCPHCGQLNELAARHARDMAHYRASYSRTEEDVYHTVRKHSGVAARAVILAALIIGILATFFVSANAFEVRASLREREALRNKDAVLRQMDQYIEDRQWRSLASMEDYYYLSTYKEPWKDYNRIFMAAMNYGYIEDSLLQFVFTKEGDDAYRMDILPDYVGHFLEYIEPDDYTSDSEMVMMQAPCAAMEEDVKTLFHTYLHVDEAEWEALKGMTAAQRAVFLEEKAEHAKK